MTSTVELGFRLCVACSRAVIAALVQIPSDVAMKRPALTTAAPLATLLAIGCASSPPPVESPRDAVTPDAAIDARTPDVASDVTVTPDAIVDVSAPRDVTSDAAVDASGCAAAFATSPIPSHVTQALLVVTPSWSNAHGSLGRFERSPGGAWTLVGERVATSIGRAGMGWGRGLHGQGAPMGCGGPGKAEGDGRSPAGVFALGAVYGDTAGAASFDYRVLTSSWRCPDDPTSRFYNQVLDANAVTPDWSSAEQMVRSDGLYHWVLFVEHNTAPRVPRGGSCIFVHVWGGAASTTSGCTSIERGALEATLAWLHPEHAVEIALPSAVYAEVRERWGLP